MKKRIPESWLSAYLDGELDAERSDLVARLVAKNPRIAQRLDELRRVKLAVASLPKAKLAGDNRRRLWSAILEHPELSEARKAALSASLDNELSPEQAELMERTASDADLNYAGKLAEVRDALRELPKYVAPKNAVEGAMARIAFEASQSLAAAAELRDLPREAAPHGLVQDVVNDLQPLAPTRRFSLFAYRRQGWATGLAASLFVGFVLFAYAFPGPAPFGPGVRVTSRLPATVPDKKPESAPEAPLPAPQQPPLLADNNPIKAPTIFDTIDDALVELKNAKPKPKPELPASLVEVVRPGASFNVPGTQFTFLCLDVKRMADRVYVVYVKHRNNGGDLKYSEDPKADIVTVEMKATPTQLASVLSDLKDAEFDATERLIADVRVHDPSKRKPIDDGTRLTQTEAITNIRRPVIGSDQPKPPTGDADKPKPPEIEAIAPDKPRQYVLIFRRQDLLPTNNSKKG